MHCERCLAIHGPGCAASYQGADGKAICVFCADSVSCPTQLRIAKGIRDCPAQTVVGLVKQLRETREVRKPKEDQMTDTSAVTTRSCKIAGAKENWPPTTPRGTVTSTVVGAPTPKKTAQRRLRCCRDRPASHARVQSSASGGGTGEPSPRSDSAGRQTGIPLRVASRKKLTTLATNPCARCDHGSQGRLLKRFGYARMAKR
jgi:hypothetical protein